MRTKEFAVLAALIILAARCLPAAAVTFPTLEGWPYRMMVSLSPGTPATDYPVRVEFDTCTFPYDRAEADGSDVRFTTVGGTVLSHWIEEWNPAGASSAWVLIPVQSTSTIFLFFGNPDAPDIGSKSSIFYFLEDWESGQNGWTVSPFGCSPNGNWLTWGSDLVSLACGELGRPDAFGCPSEPDIPGSNAEYIHEGADAWFLDAEGQANATYRLRKDLTLTGINSRLSFWATVNTCAAGNFQVQLRDPATDAVLATLVNIPTSTIVPWQEYSFDLSAVVAQTDVRLHFTSIGGNDNSGLMVVDDIRIRKSAASEPVATLSADPMAFPGSGYVSDQGSGLTLDGSGSADPNESCGDSIVTYAWDLDEDYLYDDAWGDLVALTWEQVESGICGGACSLGTPYPVGLMVTDEDAHTATAETSLVIYDNTPHASFTADPNPSGCLQDISFDASDSTHGHPGHGIVSYEWDFDHAGPSFDVDAAGVSVDYPFPAFGEYTVALRVTDDNDPPKTDLATVTVQVIMGNSAPSVDLPAGYAIETGDPLHLTANLTDPDLGCGDYLTVEWDLNNDWTFGDAMGPDLLLDWFEVEDLVCGGACAVDTPYTVNVRVTDSFDLQDEGITEVTVGALTKAAKVVFPNGGEVVPCGQPFDVTWVTQPEAAKVKLLYSPTGKKPWQLLAGGLPATDEYFSWNAPAGPATTVHKARILIRAFDDDGRLGADKSDLPFTVGRMDLTSPVGGETLVGGTTHDVTWNTIGLREGTVVETVKLLWSTDAGVNWKLLGRIDGVNPGTWSWEIPSLKRAKRNCLIRVLLKNGDGKVVARDTSRQMFTINPQP